MRITTIPAGDSSRVAYRGLSAWADRRRTRRQPPTWNAANSSRSRWKSGQMTRRAARGAPSSRAACCMTGRSWRKQRIAVQAWRTTFQGSDISSCGLSESLPTDGAGPERTSTSQEHTRSTGAHVKQHQWCSPLRQKFGIYFGEQWGCVAWEASGGAGRDAKWGRKVAQ